VTAPASVRVATVEARGLRFLVRPGTTDEKVVAEVVERRVYRKAGFLGPEPGDRWLDLGGNIGTFAVWAASLGAEVRTFEPEPENYALLVANVAANGLRDRIEPRRAAVVGGSAGTRPLYLCNGGANKYRHTLTQIRGRQAIAVECVALVGLLDGWPNAVKLDIEGAELPMLDGEHGWPGIRTLVLEYHLDRDRSLARFAERMERLRAAGFEVRHPKMPPGKAVCDWWPAAALVHAVRAAR
jgi:FkbM family methyltransferase